MAVTTSLQKDRLTHRNPEERMHADIVRVRMCSALWVNASFLVLERVTDLPPIQSSIQPEKIEKWTSELKYHEESTQDEELVAIT